MTTPPSNHPESDALWQPEPLAKPSPHYTYTFANNYREDEYKFACGMEQQRDEAVAKINSAYVWLQFGSDIEVAAKKACDQIIQCQHDTQRLTLERESLKEQLEKTLKETAIVIANSENQNQSLIAQRNLDTECIERLQRKGAENEVKIEEQVLQMAVMVGALKQCLPEWHEESSDSTHANGHIAGEFSWGDIRAIKLAIANTPLAAKDLLERVELERKISDAACEEVATHSDFSPDEIREQYKKVILYPK